MPTKKSLINENKYYGNWKKFLVEGERYRSLDPSRVVEVWEGLLDGCTGLSMKTGPDGMMEGIRILLEELSKEYGREIEESDINKKDLYPPYNSDMMIIKTWVRGTGAENRFILNRTFKKCRAEAFDAQKPDSELEWKYIDLVKGKM